MKLLITFLLTLVAVHSIAGAQDVKLIAYKDWRADKLDSHRVSEKKACVATTKLKNQDTFLEIYSEYSADGGYVQPVVQIVTTAVPPALGAITKTLPGSKKTPLSISLKETRTIEVDAKGENGETIKKELEQQVFLVKFKDKKNLIQLIKDKDTIESTFFNAQGNIAKIKFSLRGSHKTISKLTSTCL